MDPTRIALSVLVASAAIAPFAAAAGGAGGAGAGDRGDAFCFGGWGDMPYIWNGDVTDTVDKPANVVKSMNDAGIAFSIFNGDIKDGGSPCGYVDGVATDDFGVFQYAYDLFDNSAAPVVYIPGDNEWTDWVPHSHRESNDNDSASPLAMLDFIRDFFFVSVTPQGESFAFGGTKGNQLKIQHQEGQVENARWMYGGVVFLTLHVVGSNNNNAVTDGEAGDNCNRDDVASCADQVDEYEARTFLNLEWMAEAFTWAKTRSAKGVVVTWHANPNFDIQDTYDIVETEIGAEDGSNGFSSTLSALWTEAKNFDGEVWLEAA